MGSDSDEGTGSEMTDETEAKEPDISGDDDYIDEPQNSGSDLTYQIDPSTGRLLEDWYELDEMDPMELNGTTDEVEVDEGDFGTVVDSDDEGHWDSE